MKRKKMQKEKEIIISDPGDEVESITIKVYLYNFIVSMLIILLLYVAH